MKKKNKIVLITLASLSSALMIGMFATNGGASIFRAENTPTTWYHFAGTAATCETYGLKEYWTDCNGNTVIEQPVADDIQEIDTNKVNIDGIAAANENDQRLIKPFGHEFDDVTGACTHRTNLKETTNVFRTFGASAGGIQTFEETTDTVSGFDKIYQLKRTYNDGISGMGISNAFVDYDLTDVESIEFYIDGCGGEFQIATDADTAASRISLHPSIGGCDKGTVLATQTAPGYWVVQALDFKLFDNNGGSYKKVNYAVLTNRTTLNDLFRRPSDGWGTSTIKISELHITKTAKCGAKSLNPFIFHDSSKFEMTDENYKHGKYGNIYKAPTRLTSIEYGDNRLVTKAIPLDGINKIQFYVENRDTGSNSFQVLNGVFAIRPSQGGLLTYERDKDVSTTWNVTLTSDNNYKLMQTFGDWLNVSSMSLTDVTDSSGLFNFFSYSQNVYISDFVTNDNLPFTIKDITMEAIDFSNHNYVKGDTNIRGFGNFGTISTISGVNASFFSDYSLAGIKEVKFYIGKPNAELVFDGDSGISDKTTCWALHPSAGANVPGVIRLTNQGDDTTWKVSTVWNQLRNVSSGSTTREVTYTGRATFAQLLNTARDYNAGSVALSHIYAIL